jgi:hypothetical protein
MIDALIQQFAGSGEAGQVLSQLQAQGLSPQQAQGAVAATAEGAANALSTGGLAELLGGSAGLGNMLGGMLGGGGAPAGLGDMLGGMLGGGGSAISGGVGGLPPAMVETIANTIASNTGISAEMARNAVNLILPKLLQFAKSRMAG